MRSFCCLLSLMLLAAYWFWPFQIWEVMCYSFFPFWCELPVGWHSLRWRLFCICLYWIIPKIPWKVPSFSGSSGVALPSCAGIWSWPIRPSASCVKPPSRYLMRLLRVEEVDLSVRVLSRNWFKEGIKHHAHLLFVVYIALLSPQDISAIIRWIVFGTVTLLAVPKLYLPVWDQSQRFFCGSSCLLGHSTIKLLNSLIPHIRIQAFPNEAMIWQLWMIFS